MTRRLNRGLFKLALESEQLDTPEVTPEAAAAAEEERRSSEAAPAAETPAAEVPAEGAEVREPAAVVEVEVKTDGEATVTEIPAAVETAPVDGEARRETAGVATEDEEAAAAAVDAEAVAQAEEERRAAAPETTPAEGGEVAPEAVPAPEAAREVAPTADVVEVKTEEGVTAAVVETGEGRTVVETDAPAEIVVTETPAGEVKVEIEVDATAEGAREAARTPAEEPAVAEAEPAIAAEDLVEIIADGEAAEVEISDATDVAEDTAELVAEVDEAEEAVVALEALADVAAVAAQNGGLNAHGAALLKISTEHIYNHMGLGKAMGIPAMESFEIPGARASATTIALEDIKEQAKKIWVAIINGIKQAAAWIAEFISKFFTANGRIKARAEKLLEAAKKIEGQPKEKQVADVKIIKALAVNGKVSGNLSGDVKKTIDFFASVVNERTAQSLHSVTEAIHSAVSAKDATKVEDKVKDAILAIAGKGLQHKVSNGLGAKAGVADAPAGTSLSLSPTFPGEQVVWAYLPESLEAISSFRSGIGQAESKVGDSATTAVLSAAQIAEVAKLALSYVEASKAYEAVQKEVKALSDGLARDLAEGAHGLNDDSSMKGQAKSILNAIKAARHLAKGIHQPAGVVAARVVNASLDLAVASAKQYGAKVEAPAAAAAAA